MSTGPRTISQCQKPSGLLGRFTLWRMNKSHSKLTDWGLTHLSVQPQFTILDIGCGGGRTVSKLAALATQGKVYGVDYSEDSTSVSRKINTAFIAEGRVEIQQASVSQLPFTDNTFDLITAVETHFWWPNLADDLREVFRVTRPGGQLAIIAEVYKGAPALASRLVEKSAPQTGIRMLTPDEHRDLLATAGYTDIQIETQPAKGWITVTGKKDSETALCRAAHSPEECLVSNEPSPKANPMGVFQSVWFRLFLLFMALNTNCVWFVLGPSNPWCAWSVAWTTCSLVPAVPTTPVMRRVPRQWFRVPTGERMLHRIAWRWRVRLAARCLRMESPCGQTFAGILRHQGWPSFVRTVGASQCYLPRNLLCYPCTIGRDGTFRQAPVARRTMDAVAGCSASSLPDAGTTLHHASTPACVG